MKTNSFLRNIAANSITMVIIMIFQLLSVFVFIKFWGVTLYGEWIVLNAFTAYFQMTDIGLNTATGNSFTFHYARKQYDKCNILINNNIIFILSAFFIIFSILVLLIELNFFTNLLQFKMLSSKVISISLILLFAQVFVGTCNNLLNSIYIATNNYARGIMIDNIIRISEYIVLLSGVASTLSIQNILSFVLLVKIFGIVFKYLDSRKLYKIEINLKYFNYKELKILVIPAISFFSFPIANAFIFQGTTLLVNHYLGSIAVVVVNTTRTLINFIKSLIDILHKSIWPELAVAYGRNDFDSMKKMHRKIILLSITVTILSVSFLAFFGKNIYLMWTNNSVLFHPTLFYLFLIILVTNILWSSNAIILQSTNNNNFFSFLYLIAALASLGFSYLLILFTKSVNYLPLSLLLTDIILIFYVIKKSMLITGDNLSEFIKESKTDCKGYIYAIRNKWFTAHLI